MKHGAKIALGAAVLFRAVNEPLLERIEAFYEAALNE